MQSTSRIVATVVIVACAAVAGCEKTDKATHTTGNFLTGSSDISVAAPYERVLAAARAGAKDDLKLTLISDETKLLNGQPAKTTLTTRSPQDSKVTITLAPQPDGTVRVTVSTGLGGDGGLRKDLLKSISARASGPAPAPGPATRP